MTVSDLNFWANSTYIKLWNRTSSASSSIIIFKYFLNKKVPKGKKLKGSDERGTHYKTMTCAFLIFVNLSLVIFSISQWRLDTLSQFCSEQSVLLRNFHSQICASSLADMREKLDCMKAGKVADCSFPGNRPIALNNRTFPTPLHINKTFNLYISQIF